MSHRTFYCVLLTLGSGAFNPVYADMASAWQLVGKLQVTVSVKGKNQSVKQSHLDGITALFTGDGQCLIDAGAFSIEGDWTAAGRNFKTQNMSLSSANALLRGIEKDLAAKTGLSVLIEADKLTFSGTEQRNGQLKGRLKIKAHTLFLGYENKKGGLTMTYDFIGTRVESNAKGE